MLLQEIRALQAISEKERIVIPEEARPIFEHLAKYFPSNYEVGNNPTKVRIDHQKPEVCYAGCRPLLFPHAMMDRYNSEKQIDIFFSGKWSAKRETALLSYHAYINWSNKGREFPVKAWDEEYYKMLAATKFALCPDGDYAWTYRSFEAIIYKAIPIVETPIPLYEGYKYYRWNEVPIYNPFWVGHNLKQITRELFL